MSLSHPRSYNTMRNILALTAITLLPLTIFLERASPARLNACYIRREIQKPPPPLIPLRDSVLHNYSVYIMWTAMFLLALLPNARPKAFFSLTFASLWFHATYIYLAAFKAPLQDFNCAGRHKSYPNGISGHYCYFIFVAFTAARYARSRLKSNSDASPLIKAAAALLMSLFGVGGVATLHRTFFHGYHSARQISYGASLGIFSHCVLDYILLDEHCGFTTHMRLLFLLANSTTSITLYFRLWPHEAAGPAISFGHLVFHSSLWIILLVCTYFVTATEKNPAKEA